MTRADQDLVILGLTGSIGMGKSTTAQMFKDAGVPVFDSDAAVHALYAKGGEAVPLLKAVFPSVIKSGAVDRKALGRFMKADPLQLQVLESFIHPMVASRREVFLKQAKRDGAKAVLFDVPLLFETGGETDVDYVIVVTAPRSVQRQRVMARPGMTRDLYEALLKRQVPDTEKRKRADFLVFTDKGLEDARKQVQKILRTVLK